MSPESSYITPEAQAYIGKANATRTVEVTKRDIRRFALSIGDANPLYYDEEYAKGTRYGGIVAPPSFYCALQLEEEPLGDLEHSGLGKKMGIRMEVPVPGFPGAVAAGRRIEWDEPIRPGDAISFNEKVTDIYEKQGSRGPMIFIITEWRFLNQRDELCVSEIQTLIRLQ